MVSVKMSEPWSHGTPCDDAVLAVFVLKVQFAKYDCDYLEENWCSCYVKDVCVWSHVRV